MRREKCLGRHFWVEGLYRAIAQTGTLRCFKEVVIRVAFVQLCVIGRGITTRDP